MEGKESWLKAVILFVSEPLVEAERERKAYLKSQNSVGPDWQVVGVLVLVAVVLSLQEYLLRPAEYAGFLHWLERSFSGMINAETWMSLENYSFVFLLYWACGQTLLYVVPPIIFIRFVCKKSLGDYGVKLKGVFSLWWMYFLMLVAMVPIVLVASRSEGFQASYPFFEPFPNEPLWPRFWIWEGAYYLQFVGLEFFFRGFLLHGIRRQFGAYAIFVMMVPYCMIHFGKPMPETFAAIAAGIILGFMSLKTRSIWMGAALHVSVALTMDTCALWRAGKLF
jgi:membrane protease YdiL (CAAX protease family)